ncbi:MAG: cytochrome c-type biogenesis protein CcmH [Minwuiales bacterium]|nr:cytochrome c-type biogenesis protein CcmH [Minwuiales bacterium]
MIRAVLVAAMLWATGLPAHAIYADPPLADPAQEERAQELMRILRCLVCQNQAIHDSNAPLAKDLRVLVRERISAGDTDEEAIDYIVERYGDWVLLNPPLKASTMALWFGPVLVFLLGAAGVVVYQRRHRVEAATAKPLTAEERKRLDSLMNDGSDG